MDNNLSIKNFDNQLKQLVERLQLPDYMSVIGGGYLRYPRRQTVVEVTISEPRNANVFEEFVLRSAFGMSPSPTQSEISTMLGLDPMFVQSTVETLHSENNLALTCESKININPVVQDLFRDKNTILKFGKTKKLYLIEDPLTEELFFQVHPHKNAPLELNLLDRLKPIQYQYREISSLKIEDIQNLLQTEHLRIHAPSQNKFVSYFEVNLPSVEIQDYLSVLLINDTSSTQKIKVFKNNKELNKLSKNVTNFKHNFTFDEFKNLLYPKLPGFPSVVNRPDASDAQQIQTLVSQRSIKHLVHFTSIENFLGMVQEDAILSTSKLQRRNSNYNQMDSQRWDRKLNHICCSITYFNFQYHYHIRYRSRCWLLLHIRPDYLWEENTLFCQVNAATDGGARIGRGFHFFKSLFDSNVMARGGILTRNNKPDNLPTCVQAEVLVHESISLSDILRVVVSCESNKQEVIDTGWEGSIEVLPHLFEPHFTWI